jgi:uncharacterized protein YukJ
MTLAYGYVKGTLLSDPTLKGTHHNKETQYHLHCNMLINGATWDIAVNVGTNDADDLLRFKLVYDFHHALTQTLAAAQPGAQELTGQAALPALDFMRSDILADTGNWRESDPMDGTDIPEPVASLKRLLLKARQSNLQVYVFGRFFSEGNGIHDTHMNQGSTKSFIHRPGDDSNDHNDIWQDGALLVDVGEPEWVAYFAAFDQQLVPTDDLGNPAANADPIGTAGGSQ